jgi:predicted GNAT family acetyltransferase
MNTITIKHDSRGHQFFTEVDGHRAHLDYTLADGVMTITHTRVPSAIGGRGIAGELTAAALTEARSAGWTVDPVCSYAKAYMARQRPAT